MKEFKQKVDRRSRKDMIEFLSNHFRYDTMNSWNARTSYANNMKVYNLELPSDVADKLYEIMECDGAYDGINQLIDEFSREYDYRYHPGFNGRSGGYLVLYESERKTTGHKSICRKCGQLNFTSVEETGNKCGRCGAEARVNLVNPVYSLAVKATGIDQNEDFEDWSMDMLKERVELVCRFDRLCDNIVEEAAYIADAYEIEDEEYTVVKTRKVLKEREEL